MAFSVRVLADSVSPIGKRLTTFEATYPRCIHSEIMTHRMLSKNSASSRAIPTAKLIERVMADPFIPLYIGSNQRGMQAGEELPEIKRATAVNDWLRARDYAVACAHALLENGVHKQVINRLLEPWMWITIIVSATEWDNFFGLRDHVMAEPHFQHLARMMREARDASAPKPLKVGGLHLPLYQDDVDGPALVDYIEGRGILTGFESDSAIEQMCADLATKVSIGRCARVSYLTHDGRRDIGEDIALHDRLVGLDPKHASPAEHVAQAMDYPEWFQRKWPTLAAQTFDALRDQWARLHPNKAESWGETGVQLSALMTEMRSGNYFGWRQARKKLSNENIGGPMP